jgi:hypothetical protein
MLYLYHSMDTWLGFPLVVLAPGILKAGVGGGG